MFKIKKIEKLIADVFNNSKFFNVSLLNFDIFGQKKRFNFNFRANITISFQK